MQIDSAIGFENVGDLSEHIAALKEMVIFPLLYPEVFQRFNIQSPRGCLFYGPPGTGKTLVARALANEYSRSDRKITFFMRSASDCMRKYVGESERQLRVLFEQAYQMRPSIIFFDEIDGLAPVRSSKQDHIHSSIVSTLPTLLDGTVNRGEIVVIGATNRLDSIDPALRRPGRFDREFLFNLPNKEARKEIFKIHTRDWTPKPPDMLLDELAEKCIGYCGADIKSLCTEAALCSLRRCYPQIYASREKLQLDVNSIKIKAKDFFMAPKKVVPASNRIEASPVQALSPIFKPLFKRSVANILQVVHKIFPQAQLVLKEDRQQDHLNPILQDGMFDSDDDASLVSGDEFKDGMPDGPEKKLLCFSRSAFCEPTSCRPCLLIVGKEGYGQVSYVAPAVLHALEKFPVHTLDLSVLLTNVAPPEEICGQLIRNAQKTAPSIIYVPDTHLWWYNAGPALKLTFLTLLRNIPAFSPVLLLATSDVRHSDLPEEVPDYATRIKEPMDLSTVLTQIDSRQYLTAGDYLKDIDLICNNALEYYPDQRSTDCHRAYVLQNTAYSMVRNEMDTEFGRLCEQIKESREKRGRTSPAWSPWDDSKSPQQNPATEDDKPEEESNENEEMTAAPVDASTPISNGASERKRRRNNCARAAAKRSSQFDKENRVPTDDQNNSDEEEFVDKHVSDICQVKLNTEKESAKLCGYSTPRWGTITNGNPSSNDSWAFQAVTPERSWEEDQQQISDENPVQVPTETDYIVIVDRYELKKLLCFVTKITKGFDVYHLEKVYGVINQCIYNHREDYDKTDLVEVTFVLNSSTFCHCYAVFVCSGISWLFSIALYCLGVCAQTTTTVRLLPFSLEDVYPSCKTIVIFGIIVGSFCRKKLELEDNGSTHTALSKQLTLICQ
ncbi:ATPase family AAA domain-containing protein 2-like isoform X9 [Anas acuta]|uniref:ATPase family AAA domain-containing protein 2-like isoform X9 n=1 Tax=Anas acuta TaxID=28680 RepID=UPI0035C9285C